MNKVKICSVIVCIIVMVACFIYYTRYVSQTIYDLEVHYPKVESCSAQKVDTVPEGYYVYHYGNYDDLAEMEAVEVTWQLCNITNEQIDVENFWAAYYSEDGSYLYEMEKDAEALAVSDYDNRKIIPSGGRAFYTEYVLVPKGSHQIEAKTIDGTVRSSDEMKILTVTF